MNLKTLLREYIEEREASSSSRFNFLPTSDYDQLHIRPEQTSWSATDESTKTITFDRRDDLQDFINCYLELEEETGNYAVVSIDGTKVSISSSTSLNAKFKSKIDELVRETRGY